MAESIRVLHFADLHIGMENYGRLDPETGLNLRVVDFLRRLDDVVDYALAEQADAVIFAGDAFRTRDPDPTHQREFARRLRRLSEAAIPTVLLVGNHDIPSMDSRASSVDIFDTLAVPYVISVRKPDLLRLPTRHGLLQVLALPYPVRQRLLTQDQFRKMGSEELDQTLAGLMVDLLNQLAGRLDPEAPTVVAGHFSVQNAHWGSERNIMVGRDVTLPISALVDSRWDYVALGHIHQHQNLNPTNDPPVIYPGSLERVDFGEEKQPKGFVWVEVQRGKAEWKFVKLPARPFRTIRVDVQEIENPLRMVQQMLELDRDAIKGAVVRLVVQLRPEQEPLLRDAALMPFLKEAFFAQINREVARTARDRLDGLEPERMTPESLLERYLTARGKTEAEIGEYQALAQTLFQDEEEI